MTDTTDSINPPSGARAALTFFTAMLAVLTCPCHIPILIFALSGTAAGAFLQNNPGPAALLLLPIFVLSGLATWRLLSPRVKTALGA